MVAEKKDEIRAPVPRSKQRPHQVNLKYRLFSLSSIRAKRALEESNKAYVKEVVDLPTEAFQKQRC
jgi:hypothetical protein